MLKNWVTYVRAQSYADFPEFLRGGPENLPAQKFSYSVPASCFVMVAWREGKALGIEFCYERKKEVL
jgi:hypothetical protein